MSFRLAPLRLAICFTSANGSERAANARWFVIATFSGVLGPSANPSGRLRWRLPSVSERG